MSFIRDISRPVLSDKTILKYNKRNILIEGELSESQIQPNSIDLTLSDTIKKPRPNSQVPIHDIIGSQVPKNLQYIDPVKEIIYSNQAMHEDENYYDLLPGDFVLMASNEILNIPNGIIAFVQGRSSIARLGIQTEQAGLIDAGFRGTITFEVYNQTKFPIRLYKGMRVAQVYFFKAQYAKRIYGVAKQSKYSGQIEATGSRINNDPELLKFK